MEQHIRTKILRLLILAITTSALSFGQSTIPLQSFISLNDPDQNSIEITLCNRNSTELFIQCPNNVGCDSLFLKPYILSKTEIETHIVDFSYSYRLSSLTGCDNDRGYDIVNEDSLISFLTIQPFSQVKIVISAPNKYVSKEAIYMVLLLEYYTSQEQLFSNSPGDRKYFTHYQKFYIK